MQGRAKVFRRDATALGNAGTIEPFGLVFADPPYGTGAGEKALDSAAKGGWLIPGRWLSSRSAPIWSRNAARLSNRSRMRLFGDTRMHFYRYRPG